MIGLKIKLTTSGYDPEKGPRHPDNWDRTLDVDWGWEGLPMGDGNRMTSFLGGPGVEVRPGVFKGRDQPVEGRALGQMFQMEVGEVRVSPWSPQPADDPAWKATQVHVMQVIPHPEDPAQPPLVMITRLKSERASAEHIQALVDAHKTTFGARTFC